MPDQVIRVSNGASLVVRSGAVLGVGPQGPTGPKGETGDQGIQGTFWLQGTAQPTSGMREGDLWVRPSDGVVFRYDGSAWVNQNYNLRGPTGPQGVVGPAGPVGPQGPTGSASSGFVSYNDLLQAGQKH